MMGINIRSLYRYNISYNHVQVTVSHKPRWGHSLTATSLGPGLTEVIEFGGTSDPLTESDDRQPKIADTTLLQFSELQSIIIKCNCIIHDIVLSLQQ